MLDYISFSFLFYFYFYFILLFLFYIGLEWNRTSYVTWYCHRVVTSGHSHSHKSCDAEKVLEGSRKDDII